MRPFNGLNVSVAGVEFTPAVSEAAPEAGHEAELVTDV